MSLLGQAKYSMRLRTVERAAATTAPPRPPAEKVFLNILYFSLRQYYLGQVQRVDGETTILSAGLTQLPSFPMTRIVCKHLFLIRIKVMKVATLAYSFSIMLIISA